jgi:hypothetical protein
MKNIVAYSVKTWYIMKTIKEQLIAKPHFYTVTMLSEEHGLCRNTIKKMLKNDVEMRNKVKTKSIDHSFYNVFRDVLQHPLKYSYKDLQIKHNITSLNNLYQSANKQGYNHLILKFKYNFRVLNNIDKIVLDIINHPNKYTYKDLELKYKITSLNRFRQMMSKLKTNHLIISKQGNRKRIK